MEEMVSIPAVSVWGWRADGFSALALSWRICLPSPYPEAQGVSVSILLDMGAWLFDAVGDKPLCMPFCREEMKWGVTWCSWLQEGEEENDCQSHNGINQKIPPACYCLQSLTLLLFPINASLEECSFPSVGPFWGIPIPYPHHFPWKGRKFNSMLLIRKRRH